MFMPLWTEARRQAKMKRDKIEEEKPNHHNWDALLEAVEDRSQPVFSTREVRVEAECGVNELLGLRKRRWMDPFRRTNSECSTSGQ